ncbi:pentatricopeptide repeat-containing protein [Tanacetum coccineum]
MMMNRAKLAVDALLKLRFKGIRTSTSKSHFPDLQIGLESAPPLASLIHHNPCSSNVRQIDLDLQMLGKMTQKHPLPLVDDLTHRLEVVTKHNHDDFIKKSCVLLITTLLDGLIFEDRIHDAYMLLNKLIKQKLCQPTTLMYNTVIKALCNNPDKVMMDDAVKLYQEMVSPPDVVTYNALVSGLCKMRSWTKAALLLKEMLYKDISPGVETFNVLINTFCIEGRPQVARHVIYMMHERGISPTIATYNSLIDAHCVKGELDKARSLVNDMVSSHLAPDTATYTSFLNGYCNDKKMDDAMLIYHEMNEKGFKPKCVTYNLMIKSCFSAARFGDAHKLLADLLAQGLTLDVSTYRNILHDIFQKKRFDEAVSLFHLLGDDSKLNSDMSVLLKLMHGAIKCDKLDFARKLFEGLSVRGTPLTHGSYIVDVSRRKYTRHKAWDDVVLKLQSRLSKWKAKTLSIGGRLTLLKSVLGASPLYNMSIFKVPKGVLKVMESIRSNFFKGASMLEKKISMDCFDKVLASKKKGGLLGFELFRVLIESFPLKVVWRFVFAR